jgi:uncharacterized radical SAM superfamily Fe-S cluster-containing enzyme
MEEKRRAIRLCEAAGLGVVLVSTLARGVNDGEIGDMLRFALEQGTVVRGVHFQPVSSFGRFPWNLEDAPRLTLPEVMLRLEEQAPELVQVSHFNPPGGEHALCSFNAVYTRLPATWGDRDGLALLPGGGQRNDCCCPPPLAADGANKARDFVSRHWKGGKADTTSHTPMDDFAAFVAHSSLERHFTISAMAFQDALSLDLERIRGCFIHVMRPDGRLVPFCLHNLTSSDGTRLHA